MASDGHAPARALVDTAWVNTHGQDPGVRLVEVDVDTTAYDSGHIRGAVGWDWQRDLQQQPVRDIPDRTAWEALLGRSGIDNETRVVLYGDNNNWFAAFAYWLFKLYGHREVSLMDGGRQKWIDEGRLLVQDAPEHEPTVYVASEPEPELRVYRTDVEKSLALDGIKLVDVRSPQEYRGELLAPANLPQEGAQRGGHIPSAVNVPWATAVAEDGTFKSVSELEQIYGQVGITRDTPVITYCRIGERSAHTWFALHELLGLTDVRNYDGSWTEWGSLIGAPIER
jgi:thiosulfate/3-mercaptopyruvate sulfurtransferase